MGSFPERAAAKSELRTQIRLSQAHPAVTAWLVGNEANGPWQQVRVRVRVRVRVSASVRVRVS